MTRMTLNPLQFQSADKSKTTFRHLTERLFVILIQHFYFPL